MADGAGSSKPGYPIVPTYPIVYHDIATGKNLVCDPMEFPPCVCFERITYSYPNWVVQMIDLERHGRVGPMSLQQEAHRQNTASLQARVSELETQLAVANQEIVRLYQVIDQQAVRSILTDDGKGLQGLPIVTRGVKRPATADEGPVKKQKTPPVMCEFCKKKGHAEADCWKKAQKCWRCGSADHKIQDCPLQRATMKRH